MPDLRFVIRSLARNRVFTLVTVLTLALGMGSAASIFSVADWILFRATAYPQNIYLIGGQNAQNPVTPGRFDFMARSYMEQTNGMAAYAKASFVVGNVAIDGKPVESSWLGVSTNLFPMLGVTPALGRGFLPSEEVAGADQVVVITHGFWKKHFSGKDDVLGKQITAGDAICTIVGVLGKNQMMPPYLFGEIYRPLSYQVDPTKPWIPRIFLFGQLHKGINREQAASALSAAQYEVPAIMRSFVTKDRVVLSSIAELNKLFRPEIYWVMRGAVAFLYAIACLNASNLMLVRMLGQRRELSIRLALGAGRWRVVRLLALESVTLAVLSSLAGLIVANWLFPLLLSAAGSTAFSPSWTSWRLNRRVLGVMSMLTLATSLFIVIAPALRILGVDIYSALKDGGAALGESPALKRLRGSLVVLQAAFAVILLAGAGLMIETFHKLRNVDFGFDPVGRAKVQLFFPADYPTDTPVRLARLREIQTELRRIPGVREVGFGSDLLLPGYSFANIDLEGANGQKLRATLGGFNIGYQDASGLKLARGRWLDKTNGNEIMVNEALARARWPGQDPVGQVLRTADTSKRPDWKGWDVIGVVGNVRTSVREAAGYYIYGGEEWSAMQMNSFILRLSREYDETFASAIRRSLYAFDPRIVVLQINSLTAVRENQLWAEHLADSILVVLAGIALVLTVVGIFSVLMYTVDRRKGEFGVRLALGATDGDLVKLVMRRGLLLTFSGVVLGIGGVFGLTRFLKSLLFETSTQDPRLLAAVAFILLITAALACLVPAYRGTKVDVTRLLRSD